MSSCLSGGSRAFGLDLDLVKSTSTSSTTSSPSSTLSESSNTRKPRTPRKRPNQIYNEAAVLLSSVYPTIFPTKPFPKNAATSLCNAPSLFFHDSTSSSSSSELLLPCRVTDHFGFPVHRPPLPSYNRIKEAFNNAPDNNNNLQLMALGNCDDYFDQTSSFLDEEMEPVEGIESIMGVAASPESQPPDGANSTIGGCASGVPYGLGFAGLMMRRGVPALRQVDRGDWWRFPAIDMCQISPRLSNNNQDSTSSRSQYKSATTVAKKNIKRRELKDIANIAPSLMLKLDYKEVVNAWSDRGLPFDMSRPNAHAMMLAQIDLFGEGGGIRDASVLRYKEKCRTRLLSKKIIQYQVRKENADRRPRMKGRFVRRPTMKKIYFLTDNRVGRRN